MPPVHGNTPADPILNPALIESARLNMVNGQIRTNKVNSERLTAALASLPRELFVDKKQQEIAYLDEDIPLKNGRFLMEPVVWSRMLEEADIQVGQSVLLVGMNSGYEAAMLCAFTDQVTVIDDSETVLQNAEKRLSTLGTTVSVIQDSFTTGVPQKAPFDCILVNGAIATLPDCYKKQLKDNGFILVQERPNPRLNGVVVKYQNIDNVIAKIKLFDANSPYLPGFEPSLETFKF